METNRTATPENNRLSAEQVAAVNFGRCQNNPDPSSVSGLFLDPLGSVPGLEFIPLHKAKNPIENIPNLSGIKILSSCHGLLCCLGYNHVKRKSGYHVLNPTTKQLATLPEPHLAGLEGLSLAFDPSRSPDHYKVVCVWSYTKLLGIKPYTYETYYHIEIYSSEARFWRASGETFTVDAHHMIFSDGVYWNGAIHWRCDWGDSLYFNVEQERLSTMPMPPVPEGKEWYDRCCRYQLESRDHLHMIDIYDYAEFDVFEMERDYSGWYVKYRVDLGTTIGASFPPMTAEIVRSGRVQEAYSVLSLVREERDDRSFLVVLVHGKVIRYNLFDQTFETILDEEGISTDLNHLMTPNSFNVYHFIESYYSV